MSYLLARHPARYATGADCLRCANAVSRQTISSPQSRTLKAPPAPSGRFFPELQSKIRDFFTPEVQGIRRRDSTSESAYWTQVKLHPRERQLWNTLVALKTADEALPYLRQDMSTRLVLKVLRKPTRSRKTFYDILLMHKRAKQKMDESSRFYAIVLLVTSALNIHAEVLRLLYDEITTLPKQFKGAHFNHLLRIVSDSGQSHPELDAFRSAILSELQNRGLHINRRGYKALLHGARHDLSRFMTIEQTMVKAGYGVQPDDEISLHEAQAKLLPYARIENYDELIESVRNARNLQQCTMVVKEHIGNLSTATQWGVILENYARKEEAIRMCLDLASVREVQLTERLTLMLLKACRVHKGRHDLDSIFRLATRQRFKFTVDIWAEYLKKLIRAGHKTEVVNILTNEPGGNFLLDMDPVIRRHPTVWISAIQGLNDLVRSKELSGQKHARTMGFIISALRKYEVTMTRMLVLCLLDGAIYSGPRDWDGKHTCDMAVKIFHDEMDVDNHPWKIPCNDKLWAAYMTVLLLNEESNRMQEAMTQMLKTTRPDRPLLNLFALGMLETGNLDVVTYWKSYFEDELDMQWPSLSEAYAVRQAKQLQYFYR